MTLDQITFIAMLLLSWLILLDFNEALNLNQICKEEKAEAKRQAEQAEEIKRETISKNRASLWQEVRSL